MNHGNKSPLGITLCVEVCLPVLGLLSGIHPGAGGVAPTVGFLKFLNHLDGLDQWDLWMGGQRAGGGTNWVILPPIPTFLP